jgi:N-ethylmaleimide reductase
MSNRPLLTPFNNPVLGSLKTRVVMSAMTRSFAADSHLCNPEIAAYYERRACDGVGLILTEGIIIHPSGDGYINVPHLYTQKQMESWKLAIDSVHRHGSKIYAQLWHCGRISHSDFTNGFDVVSSTGRAAAGTNRQNQKPFGTPRALRVDEMHGIYAMFVHSAKLAIEAGFDGVELHMGHGYLVDQFLDAQVNDRTDEYGGSVENRCRFAVELLTQVIATVGAERVMVRISPSRMMSALYEWPDLHEMLDVLLASFKQLGLRQLDVSCANADYFQTSGKVVRYIRKQWPHLIIGGASLSIEDAEKEIADGYLDLVTWGRALIANPDFVQRVTTNLPLKTFEDSMRATLI